MAESTVNYKRNCWNYNIPIKNDMTSPPKEHGRGEKIGKNFYFGKSLSKAEREARLFSVISTIVVSILFPIAIPYFFFQGTYHIIEKEIEELNHDRLFEYINNLAGRNINQSLTPNPTIPSDVFKVLCKKADLEPEESKDFLSLLTSLTKATAANASITKVEFLNLEKIPLIEMPGLQLKGLSVDQKKSAALQFLKDHGNITCLNLAGFPDWTDNELRRLIKSCPNLEKLTLSEASITNGVISDLNGLSKLSTLKLDKCEKLTNLSKLSLPSLKQLDISSLKELKILPSFNLLLNLEDLSVMNCDKLQQFSSLDSLTKLKSLKIGLSHNIPFPSLDHTTQLRTLELFYTNSCSGAYPAFPSLDLLIELESLRLTHYREPNLSTFDQLASLKKLHLNYFVLASFQPLKTLNKLEELSIVYYNYHNIIIPFEDLTSLRILKINSFNHFVININKLEAIKTLEKLSLYSLWIQKFPPLCRLPALKMLDLHNCHNVTFALGPELSDSLEVIRLSDMPPAGLKNLYTAEFPSLKELYLESIRDLDGCTSFAHFDKLEKLSFSDTNMMSLPLLPPKLRDLSVNMTGVTRLGRLKDLQALETLVLTKNKGLKKVPKLPKSKILNRLIIEYGSKF